MNFFEQPVQDLYLDMKSMTEEEIELTLACAYNVQKNLQFHISKKSRPQLMGNLKVLTEMITAYENAVSNKLSA